MKTIAPMTEGEVMVTDVDKLVFAAANDGKGGTFFWYEELIDHQWKITDLQVRLPKEYAIVKTQELENHNQIEEAFA